jgi:hypothetical protein
MTGLTNKYVEDIGKLLCKNFIGTFPCNILPDIKNVKSFSIIFNESRHDEEGSHFVAVFADKEKIYYFDSLGLKCENKYILNFILSTGREIIENNTQIQSYDSIFCGFFCLSFIIYMSKKCEYKNFFKIYSKNLKLNDEITVELLLAMIK